MWLLVDRGIGVTLSAALGGTLAHAVDGLGHANDVRLDRYARFEPGFHLLGEVAEVVSELLDKRLGDLL
ncbi:hypothetical protein D3C72_2120190 [compost metagenome]